jgi:hypothetical protein
LQGVDLQGVDLFDVAWHEVFGEQPAPIAGSTAFVFGQSAAASAAALRVVVSAPYDPLLGHHESAVASARDAALRVPAPFSAAPVIDAEQPVLLEHRVPAAFAEYLVAPVEHPAESLAEPLVGGMSVFSAE